VLKDLLFVLTGNCQGKDTGMVCACNTTRSPPVTILQRTLESRGCRGYHRKSWMDSILEWTALSTLQLLNT